MSKTSLHPQRGQASVEAVLIVVVIVAIAMWTSQQFRSRGLIASLVDGPWAYIDGMSQHGVWANSKKAAKLSPYLSRRVSTKSVPE